MKLATAYDGTADGTLLVVSRDMKLAVSTAGICKTMQEAVEQWDDVVSSLHSLSEKLEVGATTGAFDFNAAEVCAPLPRAWQWIDGSAFPAHLDLGTRAYDVPNPWNERPLMYQGMSHRFLSGSQDVKFPSEGDGIDFEGEFAVVTGYVPMGTSAAEARGKILLVMQLNDWSLRYIGREEMTLGYGWVRAKPACSVSPVAVTPDELGADWSDARVALDLHIDLNGVEFGRANGREMAFGFDELIAHAAYSRDLPAGTIVGSGTVASADYLNVGSSCISERRGIEMITEGSPKTPFLHFGDRVRMEARSSSGTAPFGSLDQRVIDAAHGERS